MLQAAGALPLWYQFASVHTAGVQAVDPSLAGTFDTPIPDFPGQGQAPLGAVQQNPSHPAQFSYGGGNITVNVGHDITHLTKGLNKGVLVPVADSVRELPSNWLYRRGAVDPATGAFMQMSYDSTTADIASTAWWVDFSNFFEGVGALGGGNVTFNAVNNIANVDAVIPTNYRMAGHAAGSAVGIAPAATTGVELGGGNLNLNAGNNLDAGVYYVERGNAAIHVSGSIITNPTRDAQISQSIFSGSKPSDSYDYFPTSFFLGKGNIDVQAAGNILMGPVANVFLTPQGVNNSFWYKDYFSTYAPGDQVSVSSLGGDITFRESGVSPSQSAASPLLQQIGRAHV